MPESVFLFIGIVMCIVTIPGAGHDCTSFMSGKISACIIWTQKDYKIKFKWLA